MQDMIGWGSALVLLLTLWKQVLEQWQAPDTRGVSVWLFIGQATANTGFIIYSALVDNLVFTVVNSLLLATSLIGWFSLILKRRRKRLR